MFVPLRHDLFLCMDLKGLYKRFKQWQITPFEYQPYGDETHLCSNCGHEFRGNYCPLCSQRSKQGRVNWSSVRQSMLEIWGVGNRSMLYSLWQLLWRPGYFISDYINGKRQISFPPVKMLIIVSIIVMLLDSWVGSGDIDPSTGIPDDFFMKNFLAWSLRNIGWTMLIVNSFLILPTYWTFRYSPRNTAHSLPSGFFIQVFISTMMLVFALFGNIAFLMIPVYFYFTYRQLFGYGVWGTIWRLGVCFIEGLFLLSLPIVFIILAHEDNATIRIFIAIAILLFFIVLMFLPTYFINRWVSKKTPTPIPALTEISENTEDSDYSENPDKSENPENS